MNDIHTTPPTSFAAPSRTFPSPSAPGYSSTSPCAFRCKDARPPLATSAAVPMAAGWSGPVQPSAGPCASRPLRSPRLALCSKSASSRFTWAINLSFILAAYRCAPPRLGTCERCPVGCALMLAPGSPGESSRHPEQSQGSDSQQIEVAGHPRIHESHLRQQRCLIQRSGIEDALGFGQQDGGSLIAESPALNQQEPDDENGKPKCQKCAHRLILLLRLSTITRHLRTSVFGCLRRLDLKRETLNNPFLSMVAHAI